MSSYMPVPMSARTELGRKVRSGELCRAEFGLGLAETIALVALVVRHRFGLDTCRADLDKILQSEGFHSAPGLDPLRRRRYIRETRRVANKSWFEPTVLGLQQVDWAGREVGAHG